ncbi:hypothetical protein SAMN04487934_11454 [Eubacterium ruminantium]|nr:hypothetical protein SAMN04487934_11454 [Eubacterium ruminantium]
MNFAKYARCMKKHIKNNKISDERFVNALLKPYVIAGEIDNKNGEEIYFDKSRVSLLLNMHDDIPDALRDALTHPNIYKWTEDNFTEFLDEYFFENEICQVVNDIVDLISKDASIMDRTELLNKREKPNEFLADVLIDTIRHRNDRFDSEAEILRNGSYCVKVIYGDIFKYAFKNRKKENRICVIPVDTAFHLHVTRKYENNPLPQVSEKSIHGKWLTQWEQSGASLDCLKERIEKSIKTFDKGEACEGEYPLGTIAIIEKGNTVFYLIAISKFDENNNAHSSAEDIRRIIDKLTAFYDCYGQGYDIYIPLLGTGKSRANISLQESYDYIVDNLKENKSRIQGNMYIVIYKDFIDLVKTEV